MTSATAAKLVASVQPSSCYLPSPLTLQNVAFRCSKLVVALQFVNTVLTVTRRDWCGINDLRRTVHAPRRDVVLRWSTPGSRKCTCCVILTYSFAYSLVAFVLVRFNSHHWPTEDILLLCPKAEDARDALFPWRYTANLLQMAVCGSYSRGLWILESLWVRANCSHADTY